MDTIILMAPMQIKKQLNIGNLYDLLLCDYYGKCLEMQGLQRFFPLMINVNGSPIEKSAPTSYSNRQDYYNFATDMIKNISSECKRFSIKYDAILRDDENIEEIHKLLPKLEMHEVVYCKSCGSIYGSDSSIKTCRRCNGVTELALKDTFAMHASSHDVLRKANKIRFVQPSTKLRLKDYVNSLPNDFYIVLEKNRKYTTQIDDIKIDPRFTAISLLSTARKLYPNYPQIVHIHGDVVKKFTYYALVYLSDEDIPNTDMMHGNIVNIQHKKLRNNNTGDRFDISSLGLNDRELRAFLLSSSAKNDIVIDKDITQRKRKALIKTYVLMNRICEQRNFTPGTSGLSAEFSKLLEEFYSAVSNWNLPKAFEVVNHLVHKCWATVKDAKLSEEEINIIRKLQTIYFGD